MNILKRLWRCFFPLKEWQPTVAQMRAALMLRGERIGQTVVSRVGPGGDYSTMATWQEAWNATGGNLVALRTSAVVELCGDIVESHVCDGFEASSNYRVSISGYARTEITRLRRKLAETMVGFTSATLKLRQIEEVIESEEEDGTN